jgi:integrase
VGRWREDVLEAGVMRRIYRCEVLAAVEECPTKRLAQRLLEERLCVVNAVDYRPRPTTTFSECVRRWETTVLTEYKRSAQPTIGGHVGLYLNPCFGEQRLTQIHAEQVQQFLATIKRSARTRENIVATFRAIWSSAKAWGYVAHDPFDGLKISRPHRQRRAFLPVEDAQKVIRSAEEPLRTFLWLCAETGLRVGEVCGLHISDIDFDGRLLYVRQSVWEGKLQSPKSEGSQRVLKLSPDLCEHLGRFFANGWKENSEALVFASRRGTPWNAKNILNRKLHPLMEKLGIPRCGYHAFRHTNVSIMDSLNVPLAVQRGRTGHSHNQTLFRYAHAISKDEEEFACKIGAVLNPLAPKSEGGVHVSR